MPAAPSLPRALAVLIASLVVTVGVSLGAAAPVSAATQKVGLHLTVTPHYATGMVTYTGTIYPVSGTLTDVRVHLELSSGSFAGGICEPAAYCTVGFRPDWTFPTLSSRTVITFDTPAKSQVSVKLWLDSEQQCVDGCYDSIYLPLAKTTGSFSWSTSGQVVQGSTLHITARASSDSYWEPFPVGNEITLPAGVDAPTNLPGDATYYSPQHVIDRSVTLDPSDEWSFDVVVNATAGSTLTFASFLTGLNVTQGSLTIKVGEDHAKPTTTGPKRTLLTGRLSSGKVPVKLGWTGSDAGTGVATYTLAQSTDGHSWTTVASGLTSPSITRSLASGHRYRFRVRAIDHVGNVGAWAYGSTFAVSSVSEKSSTLHYGGTWTLKSSSSYRGGKAKVTSTKGRTVSRTFTGTSFGWLAQKGPTQGKAQVFVNGTQVAVVDLYAPTTQSQQLVWIKNYTSSKSRTVKIKVMGTPGRPTVNLDGVFVLR